MRRTDIIIDMLKDIPTMKAEVFMPEIANHVPHLILAYDPQVVGITPKQVQERLRTLRPQIELNPATGSTGRLGPHSNENTIVVGTWMMQTAKRRSSTVSFTPCSPTPRPERVCFVLSPCFT